MGALGISSVIGCSKKLKMKEPISHNSDTPLSNNSIHWLGLPKVSSEGMRRTFHRFAQIAIEQLAIIIMKAIYSSQTYQEIISHKRKILSHQRRVKMLVATKTVLAISPLLQPFSTPRLIKILLQTALITIVRMMMAMMILSNSPVIQSVSLKP